MCWVILTDMEHDDAQASPEQKAELERLRRLSGADVPDDLTHAAAAEWIGRLREQSGDDEASGQSEPWDAGGQASTPVMPSGNR